MRATPVPKHVSITMAVEEATILLATLRAAQRELDCDEYVATAIDALDQVMAAFDGRPDESDPGLKDGGSGVAA